MADQSDPLVPQIGTDGLLGQHWEHVPAISNLRTYEQQALEATAAGKTVPVGDTIEIGGFELGMIDLDTLIFDVSTATGSAKAESSCICTKRSERSEVIPRLDE